LAERGKIVAERVAAMSNGSQASADLHHLETEPASGADRLNGAELLDDLVKTLTRFVIFPDEHSAAAVALWIAATHALPWFDCAPRLVITSPEKRCGKTRLLDIIAGTCNHPLATSDATVAAIFRSIPSIDPESGGSYSVADDATPTLLIDEADAIFGNSKVAEQHEDLRKLLNAGHQRGRPALRCVGPHQTPTEFPTFAMAVLAQLIELYAQAGMEPPDHLHELAGSRSLTDDVEFRTTPLVECRSGSDQLRIGGLAAVFGRRSQLLGNFHEQIENQFFNESRAGGSPNVICRAEHDSRMLLGAINSRTLQLTVTPSGLDYECALAPSRRDVYDSVDRGDYAGSIFTFHCTDDTWDYRDGTPLRTLGSGVLRDVGPVTTPAYRGTTTTALRSLARHMDAPFEDVEMLSRSGELSRFFTRRDIDGGAPAKTMTGAEAYAITMSRRPPRSRLDGVPAKTIEAYVHVQGRRYPPSPDGPRPKTMKTIAEERISQCKSACS
jgi:HK97 family phage prohead protease